MNRRTQNRCRIFSALACLLAVGFLYVPYAAAAWSSHAQACCTSGYCNIPNHHHKKATTNSPAAENCGHDMGMMDCSMSCCQDADKAVVSSAAFVMPPATFAASAIVITRAVDRVLSLADLRAIEPLSPPPRTNHAAR